MKKLHFSPLWRCNERCLFCVKGSAPEGAGAEFTPARAIALVRKKRKEGFTALSIDGGEPTLYPGLARLVRAALACGYAEVSVLTNGVLLADKEKLRALLGCHPEARERLLFCVSLHSHRARVSDLLTAAPGAFDKTVKAVRNMLAEGCRPSLYHVMTRLGARDLPAFARFAAREFPGLHTVTFSYIYPAQHKLDNMRIYPRLSDIPRRLARAARLLRAAGIGVELSSCGVIPWCLLKGAEGLFLSRSLEENAATVTCDTSKAEPMPFLREIYSRERKVKPAACARCPLDLVCGGVWEFYAGLYGTAEIKPFSAAGLRRIKESAGPAPVRAVHSSTEETCLRVFDARLKGHVSIELAGAGKMPGLGAVRRFAAGIGCLGLRASRRRAT